MINPHPDTLHAIAGMIGILGCGAICTATLIYAITQDKLLLGAVAIGIPMFALIAILGLFS